MPHVHNEYGHGYCGHVYSGSPHVKWCSRRRRRRPHLQHRKTTARHISRNCRRPTTVGCNWIYFGFQRVVSRCSWLLLQIEVFIIWVRTTLRPTLRARRILDAHQQCGSCASQYTCFRSLGTWYCMVSMCVCRIIWTIRKIFFCYQPTWFL